MLRARVCIGVRAILVAAATHEGQEQGLRVKRRQFFDLRFMHI